MHFNFIVTNDIDTNYTFMDRANIFFETRASTINKIERMTTVNKDTGCLVAFTKEVDYDVQFVGNIKSALFGGEGLFLATLRGPGYVWLQSLPFSRMADRIFTASKKAGGESKGEGSLLGGIGLGNILGND